MLCFMENILMLIGRKVPDNILVLLKAGTG